MDKDKDLNNGNNKAPQLSFADSLRILMQDLPKRSQEIIFSRYGIIGKKPVTLEGIGKKYGITRERVRQVVREVFKKVKDKKKHPAFVQMSEAVEHSIRNNHGIMEKGKLLAQFAKDDVNERGAVVFFLECFEGVRHVESKGEILKSYVQKQFDFNTWKKVKDTAKTVLEKKRESLREKEFIREIAALLDEIEVEEEMLMHFIESAEEIAKNNFGKWGLVQWKEISPKGTKDKAYLVLKEAGKPLHFRMIAEHIDLYKLNKKKTHPQTVHNELIKDKNFVLVGRGIYALAGWGYKKGTVRDVIEDILAGSDKPLSREEIMKRVLEVRHVKKSTIVINVNNFFKKTEKGYTLKG